MTEILLKSSLQSVQSSLQNPMAGVICVATAASVSFGQTQLPATVIPAHAGSVSIHCSMDLPMGSPQHGNGRWESQRQCQGTASNYILEKTNQKNCSTFSLDCFVTKMERAKKTCLSKNTGT